VDLHISNGVEEAAERIKPHARKTPLEYSPGLSEELNCNVYLKLENWQITGSFKPRGALNKIIQVYEQDPETIIITASTGNHAAAVAYAISVVQGKGIIYLPLNVSKAKIKALRNVQGVGIEYYGNDSVETERAARKRSSEGGKTFVSPYNDLDIIHGQGTIGAEILAQLPGDQKLDAVFVPVGGGGLVSGIAGYIKELRPDVEIIGCQPENSAVMYHSLLKGKILEMESHPTLSDGTAGGVEEDSITFEFCQKYVDQWILVKEEQILKALRE
jgi:threonine dehydratase